MAFGEAFVKELKRSGDLCGCLDVPVGDYKPSHLSKHPDLKRVGAPMVHFNQTDGEDCLKIPYICFICYWLKN
jgi:hypothetical protein